MPAPAAAPAAWKPARAAAFFRLLQKANPRPTTELQYSNTYQLLVAVTLSAQATDKSVNAATRPIFAKIKTPAQMLAFGEPALRAAISSVGLFRVKARNVLRAAKILQAQHGGQTPNNRAALQALPGVGRKTANVVLNTAFGEPAIAVDTHIFRVANRVGIAPGKTPRAVEDALLQVVPQKFKQNAHHWLILHGRYTCRARAPLCGQCAVWRFCQFSQKLPRPRARAVA